MVASARFDPGPTYASGERSARSSSSIRASRWSVSAWASSRAIRRLWMLYRRGRRSRPLGGPLKSFAIASRKPGAFKCSFAALGSPALLRSAGFNTSNATSSAASRAELSANDSCSHQSPGARLPRECNITLCDIASSVFARKSLQIGGSVSRQRAFTRHRRIDAAAPARQASAGSTSARRVCRLLVEERRSRRRVRAAREAAAHSRKNGPAE